MKTKEVGERLNDTDPPGGPPSERSDLRGTYQLANQEKKVHAEVAHLWDASWGRQWSGKRGLTAWSAYKELLLAAWYHGELILAGVRISISMRQWAERTGVGLEAINNSSKLLMKEGLIRRDGRGQGPESGAFVLLRGSRSTETLTQEYHLERCVSHSVPRCFVSARVPLRWGGGRLGKLKEALLDALRRLGDSATDTELAAAIHRQKRVRDVRKHLEQLRSECILKCSGGRYYFHEDSGFALTFTRMFNGELDAAERQKEKHKEQREKFRERWERGEVLSRAEKDKRRRRRKSAEVNPEREKVTGAVSVVQADSPSERVAEVPVEVDEVVDPLDYMDVFDPLDYMDRLDPDGYP